MKEPFRLKSISFTGGQTINVADSDFIVLVGPNSSGKSRTLRDVQGLLSIAESADEYPSPVAVNKVELDYIAQKSEMLEWLKANRYTYQLPYNNPEDSFRFRTLANASGSHVENDSREVPADTSGQSTIGMLGSHLINTLYTESRLSTHFTTQRIETLGQPQSHMHALIDPNTLETFTQRMKQSFGWYSILDAWGSDVKLRVSDEPQSYYIDQNNSTGLVSTTLAESLNKLQLMDMQSDGVRSFASVLLSQLSATFPLSLIDEAEAFLHPPQARLLGKTVVELREAGQAIITTHDINMLAGLLDDPKAKVSVLRLNRNNSGVHVKQLNSEDIKNLWSDPLIRYSRALEGLFHDGVVVCEGDSDCQFYSAIYDLVRQENKDIQYPDISFVYAGGKGRSAKLAKALRAVGVPVAVILDFDALNNAFPLNKIVEAMGGDVEKAEKLRNRVSLAISKGKKPVTKKAFEAEVSKLIGNYKDADQLTSMTIRSIEAALKADEGWVLAKNTGKSAIPAGAATQDYNQLSTVLKDSAIYLVEQGQLESFVKEVGGHGSEWLALVMEKDLLKSSADAMTFIKEVAQNMR